MIAPIKLAAAALACSAALASAAPPATPDPSRILAAMRAAHPGTSFTAVKTTPMAGVFEVQMGANIAYVNGTDTRHLLFGRLYDTGSGKDLTAGRLATLKATAAVAEPGRAPGAAPFPRFSDLPLKDAIKTLQGDGSRVLVVFSDPSCGYCRHLDATLSTLKNVTVYTFVVPFQGGAVAAAAWCAPDRHTAWRLAMAGRLDVSAAPADCGTPFARNVALAGKHGVLGTPAMFFADGSRLDGAVEAAEIEARLSTTSQQVRP